MLNVKKTLTKILTQFSAPTVSEFAWSSPWTATASGIMVMRVTRTTSAGEVDLYIKDTTAGIYGIGALATPNVPANFQNSICFPVIKGHKYETEYTSGVGAVTCRFYKISSWGGVIRQLLSRLNIISFREEVMAC